MTFALVLLLAGGFLLGGAWSVWRLDTDEQQHRTPVQIVIAVVLLVAALLATAAGILRLI